MQKDNIYYKFNNKMPEDLNPLAFFTYKDIILHLNLWKTSV